MVIHYSLRVKMSQVKKKSFKYGSCSTVVVAKFTPFLFFSMVLESSWGNEGKQLFKYRYSISSF